MLVRKKTCWQLALALSFCAPLFGIYDNRFIPLFDPPRLALDGTDSVFGVYPMAATASYAYSDRNDGKEIGIPEIYGLFDLVKLDEALGLKGCTDESVRLDPAIRGSRGVPWHINGKLQFQGVSFFYHQALHKYASVGASWYFLRANAHHDYRQSFDTDLILRTGNAEDIERKRRAILDALGLFPGQWGEAGFGDIDAYFRVGNRCDYRLRFRRIDFGFRVGMLAPTGVVRAESRIPSVPLGGDGFWGAYLAADLLLEPKEDLKACLYLRSSKRFSRTVCRRFPIEEEPQIFGASLASVTIDPGFTFVVVPTVILENLRGGFGLSAQYTLVYHLGDSWKNVCLLDSELREAVNAERIKQNICVVEKVSKWGADYITLDAFYDFGRVKVFREFDPVVSLRWDIPRSMIVASRSLKTHRLSLGVEVAF